jgi:hypothetical protein
MSSELLRLVAEVLIRDDSRERTAFILKGLRIL